MLIAPRARKRSTILASTAMVLAACGPSGDARGLDTSQPVSSAQLAATPHTVNPLGIGAMRAGMTVGEASQALGVQLTAPDSGAPCTQIRLDAASPTVLLMVLDQRIVRVDVTDTSVATDRGARVGNTEARIAELYTNQLRTKPHKYTDGHYLVVTPTASADSLYRLIFETNGQQVTRYRAGLRPAVEWVEGCG